MHTGAGQRFTVVNMGSTGLFLVSHTFQVSSCKPAFACYCMLHCSVVVQTVTAFFIIFSMPGTSENGSVQGYSLGLLEEGSTCPAPCTRGAALGQWVGGEGSGHCQSSELRAGGHTSAVE